MVFIPPLKTPRNKPKVETLRQQGKKLKTLEDTKTFRARGLAELIMWEWACCRSNLQISCYPHWNPHGILHGIKEKKHRNIHNEVEKMLDTQVTLSRTSNAGGIMTPHLSNQNDTTPAVNRHTSWEKKTGSQKPTQAVAAQCLWESCWKHKEKDSSCSQWCWGNSISTHKSMKWGPSLSASTKVNSKWIKSLNVRAETQTVRGKERR